MSQRNNFWGSFLLGTLIGGVTGTVVGVLLGSRSKNGQPNALPTEGFDSSPPPEQLATQAEYLEAKIAQLNEAIDDVRQHLNSVKTSS